MPLPPETPRPRWSLLLAAWAGCALLLGLHTLAVRDYHAFVDGVGRRAEDTAATPLRPFVPARFSDAQMWVRHTLTARETGVARVRFTDTDNAPQGRAVHWSSGFRWLLAGAGTVRAAATGEPTAVALDRALLWLNAPLLLALIVLLSSWAARRAGTAAGILVTAGMVGLPRFYDNFTPMNADHHGLIAAALLGLLLGVAGMGAGWWQPAGGTRAPFFPASPAQARSAAIFSALCGAVGMAISAASTIPAIAIVGVAGVTAAWWAGPQAAAAGARFEPAVWRCWGRVGGVLSAAFYLFEYAPAHLGWRLEVNHPLYALAWWGGGELVAALGAWHGHPARGPENHGQDARATKSITQFALPILAVLAPLVVIVAGGTAVFALRDPFIGDLRHFVIEGQTLPTVLRRIGARPLLPDLALLCVVAAAAVVLFRARGPTRLLLAFLLATTAAWAVLTFAEIRWMMALSVAQLTLFATLLSLPLRTAARGGRFALVGSVAFAVVAVGVARVATERDKIARRWLADDDVRQLVFRDIAAALRATQPAGELVLLASPNASMGIGAYGGFKTLGTLFWENAAGLKAAARILCARTDAEAEALIRGRGVTHLAFVPGTLFHDEYFRLLHPGAPVAGVHETVGHRLAAAVGNAPRWLQPVPYRWRGDLDFVAKGVRLFRVAFDQTEAEQHFHTAVAEVARDDVARAEQTIERALAATPAAQHADLCEAAGAAFYDYGADAAAVRLFRRALTFGYDPAIATTVAWILASTEDATLRDGRAALALLAPQLERPPADPAFLSALAAASAEVGRFADAVAAAQRAVELARAAGDRATETLLQRRLDTYRSGRTWRQ